MVNAILNGTKTQTRRQIKPQPKIMTDNHHFNFKDKRYLIPDELKQFNPYGMPGDVLWVRETWQETTWMHPSDENYGYIYKASDNGKEWANTEDFKWKSSIFMPRSACRLFLEITSIRVERLQYISEPDAIAEGVGRWTEERLKSKPIRYQVYDNEDPEALYTSDPIDSFKGLWESINANWETNPWVWVVDFKPVAKPNDF